MGKPQLQSSAMKPYALLGARIAPQAMPPVAAPAAAALPRQWTFKALSTTQRQTIGRLGTAAYQSEVERGNITVPATGKTAHVKAWRHAQYLQETGREDLDQCNQSHFRDLCKHFNALIGTPASSARSVRDAMRTGRVSSKTSIVDTYEARELWRHKLNEALKEWDFTEGYAAAICRSKYKCALGQANPDQLRSLTFAVIGNGRKKKPAKPAPAPSQKLTIIKPGKTDAPF